jgi:hypothetical protein
VRYTVRTNRYRNGSWPVKKGRHRRFEEARALKRSGDLDVSSILGEERSTEPCPECGAAPGAAHQSWCLHDEVVDDED